jgi:hypothetical protein
MNVHARVAPQNHKNRQTLNENAIKKNANESQERIQ